MGKYSDAIAAAGAGTEISSNASGSDIMTDIPWLSTERRYAVINELCPTPFVLLWVCDARSDAAHYLSFPIKLCRPQMAEIDNSRGDSETATINRSDGQPSTIHSIWPALNFMSLADQSPFNGRPSTSVWFV